MAENHEDLYFQRPGVTAESDSGDYRIEALRDDDLFRLNTGALFGTPITITYAFMTEVSDEYDGSVDGFAELTTAQKNVIRDFFAVIEAETLLTITETDDEDAATIRFGRFDELVGYGDDEGHALPYNNSWMYGREGDVWINNSTGTGAYSNYVLMHEAMHILGGKHPHDGMDGLPNGEDNTGNTLLSYNGSTNRPSTPAEYDLLLLQYYYGINGAGQAGAMQAGGDDKDILRGDSADDIIYGNDGNDRILGKPGDDNLYGGAGIDRLYGNDGNDYIDGGDDNDRVKGGDGDDLLIGGGGVDKMFGHGGVDWLYGGADRDVKRGGDGEDRYIYRDWSDSLRNGGYDIIYDFTPGEDIVDLSTLFSLTEDTQGVFMGTAEGFTGQANEWYWFEASNRLFGDRDGDMEADFAIRFKNLETLTEDDILMLPDGDYWF